VYAKQDLVTAVTDALKSVAISTRSMVNVSLDELGLAIAFNNEGQTLYTIADYANRTIHDYFVDAPLVAPVGYTTIDNRNRDVYGLNTPSFIHPPTSDISVHEITAQLSVLKQYAIDYDTDHNLGVALKTLAPMFFVFKDDFDNIDLFIENKIHPKRIAELLALNFTLYEILEYKDVSASYLLSLGKMNPSKLNPALDFLSFD